MKPVAGRAVKSTVSVRSFTRLTMTHLSISISLGGDLQNAFAGPAGRRLINEISVLEVEEEIRALQARCKIRQDCARRRLWLDALLRRRRR